MTHDTARSFTCAGARLHTRSGAHPLEVRVAANFTSRLRGLMLRKSLPPEAALLIAGCPSVHTAFMRFAIDVVYLDAHGVVMRCVPELRPWRASVSQFGRDAQGRRHRRAAHTLELAAGSIERWALAPGDRLEHARWPAPAAMPALPGAANARRQRGSAMTEFVVVAPILTVIGLALTQYGLLFFAKNQVSHAGFMAARAGSVGNADPERIGEAYAQALVPLHGGGDTAGELAAALVRAKADVLQNSHIDMLNPTRESFADWNEPALQAKWHSGARRVIPNSHQATKDRSNVGAASGQSIQDANLIKLRITHGLEPKVPIVASIYRAYLKWRDDGTDPVRTRLIDAGRIPVVTDVTVQMQSDAIEPGTTVSSPGAGNGGAPTDPGSPPGGATDPGPPPDCRLGGCSTPGPGDGGAGGSCPAPISQALSADTLFAFDSATLLPAGTQALDQLIAKAQSLNLDLEAIKVTGYTDPLGTDAHNLALSKARADAVANYLNARGLNAGRVDVEGRGATDFVVPLSACPGPAGAQQQACLAPNRRVVVELIPK